MADKFWHDFVSWCCSVHTGGRLINAQGGRVSGNIDGGGGLDNSGTITGNVTFAGTGNLVVLRPSSTISGNLVIGAGNDTFVTNIVNAGPGQFAGVNGTVTGSGAEILRYLVTADANAGALNLPSMFNALSYDLANNAKLTLSPGTISYHSLNFEGTGTVDLNANFSEAGGNTAMDLTRASLQATGDASLSALDVTSRGTLTAIRNTTYSWQPLVAVSNPSKFTNAGTINAQDAVPDPNSRLIAIQGSGTVVNSGVINLLNADGITVATSGSSGLSVINSGTITGISGDTSSRGISSARTVVNTGTIATGGWGVLLPTNGVSLTNSGMIKSAKDSAVWASSSSIANQSGGVISGAVYGINLNSGTPSITNAGVIAGGTYSIYASGTNSFGLTLQTGSSLTGDVSAGMSGNNSLILQGSGAEDSKFINFTSLNMQGPGLWTLSGISSIATTTVSGGTLAITGGLTSRYTINNGAALQGSSATLLAQGAFTDNGTVSFTQSADGVFAAVVSGSGSLSDTGPGKLTLTGVNTYTGATTISSGVLALSGSGSISSSSGVADVGALDISGITATAAGITTLSGSGTVILGAKGLILTAGAGTFSGVISGTGSLTQSGTGTTILTGNNTYTGGTTISAGTLQIGNGGTSGAVAGNITDNAGLVFSRSDTVTFGGVISGTGSLIQAGVGTLTLTGNNTYSGGTTISAGTLQIGNLGTAGMVAGNIVNNATLVFSRTDGFLAFGGAISGTGSVKNQGLNVLELTGNNSYTGGTVAANGILVVGDGGRNGSIVGDVVVNAFFEFNRSDAYAFAGNVSGTGRFTQVGTGNLILTGSISAADVEVSTGSMQIGNGGTAGSLSSSVTVLNGGTLIFDRSDVYTYAGNVFAGTGGGTMKQIGSGTLILTGSAPSMTISAGTVQVGNGGTTGQIGSVVDNAALIFNRSDNLEVSGAISGTGSVTKLGAGKLILTGNGSYAGGTVISAGILQVGNNGISSGSGGLGTGGVVNNAALVFATSAATFANVISGSGTVTIGGPTTLTSVNSYTGTTTINGTLNLSGAGSIGGSSSVSVFGSFGFPSGVFDISGTASGTSIKSLAGAGTVNLGSKLLTITAAADTFSGIINGTGGITIAGGTETFAATGVNSFNGNGTYTGGTTIDSGASLVAAVPHSIAFFGAVVDNGTFDISGTAGTSVTSLSGKGTLALGASALTLTNASGTFSGNFTGTGVLDLVSGTEIITGDITSPSQVLTGATLQIGNGGSGGSLSGRVGLSGTSLNPAKLAFNRNDAVTYAGTVSGNGVLMQIGVGTLTLTGANSYTGGTVISAGTLQIGAGGTTGSIAGNVAGNGALVFNRSDALTFAGVVSGTGSVTQSGTGTLILTGSSTYTGATAVGAGTLAVTGSIAASSGVTVANGATLTGTGTVAATTIQSGGTLAAGNNAIGTLNVGGNLTLASGSTMAIDLSNLASDLVLVSGNASLAGTLATSFTTGVTYTPGKVYTLLTSTGLVSGGFDSFTVAGLPQQYLGQLSYDAHDVFLTVIPADFVWNAAPVSSDWNNGANWKYGLVPGAGDIAQFDATNAASVVVSQADVARALQFNAGAPAYSLAITGTASGSASLTVSQGITDASSNAPAIAVSGADAAHTGTLAFTGTGNAADAAIIAGAFGTVSFAGTTDAGAAAKLTANAGGSIDFSATSGANGDNKITAGSIAGGGSFVLGASTLTTGALNTSTEVNGVISGSGGLTKTGSGTLTLSGADTYTGGTTISGGTLQLGNGGTSGSVNGNIVDNAALVFNRSDSVTFAGVISGTGTVTQAGSGTLILTGANTYSGTTTVSGGILRLGTGGSIGSGALIISGGIFDPGSQVLNSSMLSGTGGTINLGTGGLNANAAGNQTISVIFTGTGGILKSGSGILLLTGNNSFSGGITIAGGTVNLGNSNAAGTGTITTTGSVIDYANGDVINNPILINSNTTQLQTLAGVTATQAGAIAETGGARPMEKTGTGTLILTGTDTYTGGTTITAGTLQLGNGGATGSITGNVADNAALVFNRADAVTFAGVISGSGTVTQAGSGTTTLTGASTYTGATTVSAGALSVNGTIASNVTVSGGALKGTGKVGNVTIASGGTLAPGNSIGTLNTGNVSFATGSTYQVEVDNSGHSDLINATGTVTLNGTVQILEAAGTYSPVTTYRFINASGGISGSFAAITSSMANLTPTFTNNGNTLDVRLTRNDLVFGSYGTSANQMAVGSAVSAAGVSSSLYNALALTANTASAVPAALDSLSGEIHATVRSTAIDESRTLRLSVLDELSAAHDQSVSLWGAGFAGSGHIDSNGNAASVNDSSGGGISGIDASLGGALRAGVAGAYTSHAVGITDRASHASGATAHALVYAGWSDEALHVKAGADFGWGHDDIQRGVSFLGESDASRQNMATTQAFGEIGYDFDAGIASLQPYAQIVWAQARSGAFAETVGALSALSGKAASDSVTYGTFGLHTRFRVFDLDNGMTLTPRIDLGLQHAFSTFLPSQVMALGGNAFSVTGAPLATDSAAIAAGLDLALSPSTHLSLGYDGALAAHATSNSVRAGLRWNLQ